MKRSAPGKSPRRCRAAALATTALVLLVLAGRGAAQGAPPVPAELARQVERLVAELDDPAYERREAASRALAELGPAIRDLLAPLADAGPAERRLRIRSLLAAFPPPAGVAVRLEGTRVTLRHDDATLDTVLVDLERRCGLRFHRPFGPEGARRLALHVEDVPAFEALDRIAAAVELRWYRDWSSGTMRFAPRLQGEAVVAYPGPLRIALNGVTRTRRVEFGAATVENLTLTGVVDVEPDCPVAALATPPRILTAVDAEGRALIETGRESPRSMQPIRDRGSFAFALPLQVVEGDPARIARLEGEVEVLAVTARDELVVRLDGGPSEALGPAGARAALVEQTVGPTERRVRIAVRHGGFEGPNGTLFDRAVRFEDARGGEIATLGPPAVQSGGADEILDFRLPPGAAPARVVLALAVQVEARTVRFAFEDVPLR